MHFIFQWHKIRPGRELSQIQQEYLVDVIMTWIEKELVIEEFPILCYNKSNLKPK